MKRTRRNHVWIVEMNFGFPTPWFPTVGCALSRDAAMEEKRAWEENNPRDKFRIRKYEAPHA